VNVDALRARFSSLQNGFAFFDAPGGTQVPDEVGQAIANALREASGNLGAPYATGRAVEAILARAKDDAARFLGASADEISFGMNMTTLDFALSRTAARDFSAGDEILTTQLDHDGGVAPWVELAEDKGLVVRVVEAKDDLTVDYDDLERQLSDRTRVLAFAFASNATGTVADAKRICALARSAGAISWIDAVHYAAHEPIDVRDLGCDVLLCSPYKFCGPHLGIAYVRSELAATWRPYKARPAAFPRCATTSASSASTSWPSCRSACRCTARRRWTAAFRPSSSTSTAYPRTRPRIAWASRASASGTPTTGTASPSARACRSNPSAPASRTTTRAPKSTAYSPRSRPCSPTRAGLREP
jgi:selenocysteine lyase/cysteine desulfurase